MIFTETVTIKMGKLLIGVKCLADDRCNLLMEFVLFLL